MWAQACQFLEEAERLHRQFFRLGPAMAQPAWEPPVDVFEGEREIIVVVALPGVSPDCLEATYDAGVLLIRAERRIPFEARGSSILQLEIPYGCFERRVALPPVPLEPGAREWVDGCLILTMRKRG